MREKRASRYDIARKILIIQTLFIAVGAVVGSVCMLIEPSGSILQMQDMLVYFQKLPLADVLFKDYVFSGIALLIVNGLTNIVAAVLLISKKKLGVDLATLFGITLMLWICIQFYMWGGELLSVLYFIFGFLQLVVGYAALVFYKQESFVFDESLYNNIGKNSDRLVVYFSRMGYCKKAAYEQAEKCGAELYEIRAKERTEGTLGFWWCGRFAMLGREMPIAFPTIDFSRYEQITIVSPIWAFGLSAPVRAFCRMSAGKIKAPRYVLLHFTRGSYTNVVNEMNELLETKAVCVTNICCRKGVFKDISEENK